jgi:hypothetical protein
VAKVLIYGLPGAGKSHLAEKVSGYLGDSVVWLNADKVREEANDWDFSDEGRARQNARMKRLAREVEAEGKVAICDFVCPTRQGRIDFGADYQVFVDTIEEGRFEDTNKIFERQRFNHFTVHSHNDSDAIMLAWELGNHFIWNNSAPTTQMLGRFQPWHEGHQALFERALAKHGQVFLMVRDMPIDDKNPFDAHEVVFNLKTTLVKYAGRVKVSIVPNIMNITYGRDVGYKIEQEVFDDRIHSISATKIREQMRKEGKL